MGNRARAKVVYGLFFTVLLETQPICVFGSMENPTLELYGRMNLSIEQSWAGVGAAIPAQSGVSTLQAISASSSLQGQGRDGYIVDNSSRFGIRGFEILNEETAMVFQYETSPRMNTRLRDTFVGINNDRFGLIRFGIITTNNYYAWDDGLNDLNADTGTTADQLWQGPIRIPGSLAYQTPWINNLRFSMQFAKNNNLDIKMLAFQTDVKYGAAVLGAGLVRGHFGQNNVSDYHEWSLSGAYTSSSGVRWGALVEGFRDETPGKEQTTTHYLKSSVKVPLRQGAVIVNMGYSLLKGSGVQEVNAHGYQYQIGYVYPFSLRTKGYVFMQSFSADTSIPDNFLRTLGVGLRVDF